MSKLFKLKDWFTLSEAAKYLTASFGEEVTEVDVLRLALDGHLVLSVNLVNSEVAFVGKMYPIEEVEYREAELPIPGGGLEKVKLYGGTVLRTDGVKTHVLKFEKNEVFHLDGVYDLPLIGGEAIDVEELYCKLAGQHYEEKTNIDGTFLKTGDEQYLEVLESFDDNEFQRGSRAQLEALNAYIAREKVDAAEAESLLQQHKVDRAEFMKKQECDKYFPAGRLGSSFFVVRNESLTSLLQEMAKQDDSDTALEKPLTTKERKTLLLMIVALCKYAGIDLSQNHAAGEVVKRSADDAGLEIGLTTIKNKLREAVNLQ